MAGGGLADVDGAAPTDANAFALRQIGKLAEESAIRAEDLDPMITAVLDVEAVVIGHREIERIVELSGSIADVADQPRAAWLDHAYGVRFPVEQKERRRPAAREHDFADQVNVLDGRNWRELGAKL